MNSKTAGSTAHLALGYLFLMKWLFVHDWDAYFYKLFVWHSTILALVSHPGPVPRPPKVRARVEVRLNTSDKS